MESWEVVSVLSERFNELWDELTTQFDAYNAIERIAENVIELATARADLDHVRAAIVAENRSIRAERNIWPRDTPWRSATRPVPLSLKVDADYQDLVVTYLHKVAPSA
jgi:hypothetical protein